MAARSAVTVLGPVDGAELGFVLPHEHLTVDNRVHMITAGEAGPDTGLSLATLAQARIWPRSIAENIVLDRDDVAADELVSFRGAGGGCLVELTPIAMGRDVGRLHALARATGVHIVAATGYYVQQGHKGRVAGRSVDDICDELISELTTPDDGGSRCGVIGEIGISADPHPDEWLVLRASMAAQEATGAPVWIHVTGSRPVPALLDFLASSGKDLGRIAISHMDFDLDDLTNHRRAADLGLCVELDLFGFPIWTAGNFLHMPTDTRRVEVLIELARAGYGGQLLISHDVCMKMQLPPWGGFGYSHILRNVVPLFEMLGSEAGLVSQICYENPRRLLCWSDAS